MGIFGGYCSVYFSLPSWKMHLSYPNISQSLIPLQHQLNIQNLIQISESNSGMGEILHVIHTGTKFLSLCEPVKLENTLPAPRIQ